MGEGQEGKEGEEGKELGEGRGERGGGRSGRCVCVCVCVGSPVHALHSGTLENSEVAHRTRRLLLRVLWSQWVLQL
jgi:hypothetical protein